MPYFIDDLLLRYDPTGVLRVLGGSFPPFDQIWLTETLRDEAQRELYNPEKIADEIKNNRMLYELGEISKEEYERKNKRLNRRLKIANHINSLNSKNILG